MLFRNHILRVGVSLLLLPCLLMGLSACEKDGAYEHTPGAALPRSPFSAEGRRGASRDLSLAFNAVYRLFGGSDAENCLVYRFGNEPTYFEWMALKLAWTPDEGYVNELKQKLLTFPQTDNGYLWSWGTSTYWPTGRGAVHYDGLFRYIAAAAELVRWEGSAAFLSQTDPDTFGEDTHLDASQGRTVYEKCAAAMNYALRELGGESGLVTITERSVYLADGKTRFDVNEAGEYVWDNTGRPGAASSNYWDNLCFGHLDAYENALFYHALLAMADIEDLRGETAAAETYRALSVKVKAAFNETFWDEAAGRYIACVDADGSRWDPGLTFLNTEALAYGLGTEAQAARVFSWLDGERTVPGDTVAGRDIMSYTAVLNRALDDKKAVRRRLSLAPVTNTVSIEALAGDGEAWWFSLEGAINVGRDGNAAFGHHLENGGYIFYTVYYELMARAAYQGANAVLARARDIAAVYRFNGLNSDVGLWAEGLVGEFPENGVVSRAFVSAMAGLQPTAAALKISPALPQGIRSLGIEAVQYAGAVFHIEVGENTLRLTSASGRLRGTVCFYPAGAGPFTVRLHPADGSVSETVQTPQNGCLTLDFAANAVVGAEVEPAK